MYASKFTYTHTFGSQTNICFMENEWKHEPARTEPCEKCLCFVWFNPCVMLHSDIEKIIMIIYMCELWIAKTRLWILDLERLSYVFQILFCLDKQSPTSMLSLFCRPPPLHELWWLQKDSSIRVTFPIVFRTNLWCAKGKKNGFRIQIWILFKKVSRSTAPYGWWKKSG